MATTRQLSFSGGEIAPSLYARVDQDKYATGLRTCRNFLVMRHGGAANRPGTRFVAEVKDSTKKVKLIPFVFNDEQTYVMEFGEQYIRFFRAAAAITVSGVAAWVTSTAYVIGDLVLEGGVHYYAIQAHTSSGANQPPDAAFWHVLTGTIFEIPTPYLEAELAALEFVQSADVVTIVHPSHAPRDLKRFADTNWTLTVVVFGPTVPAPTALAVGGTAGSNNFIYHVTSIDASTTEESLAATVSGVSLTDPSTAQPHTITWTEEATASKYNVYLEENGVPGFIGIAVGAQFINDGIEPDVIDTPPEANNPYPGTDDFPSTVTYYQQRLMLANTNNNPEEIQGSKSTLFNNFSPSTPLQADDPVSFTLVGREVNQIRHMIELATLVVFTSGGEWSVQGDEAGILKPVEINPKQHTYNGSGVLPPLTIDGNALYLQGRQNKVRDLGFDFEIDGYRGNDLTIFSAHLFDQFTLVDWFHQRIPHSIVWVVRSDGVLLGLTYVREQEVLGWHRHDTDGSFENVTVVPEGREDAPYFVIQRTVDGNSVRYIERMETRAIDETAIEDSIFMDSTLSFDGTNTTAITMTLTGGPPWGSGENLTLAASAAFFVAGDVGNQIHLTDAAGFTIKLDIFAFTSDTVVSVRSNKNVPVTLQGVARTTWGRAVDTFGGLSHLEGKDISAFGDGFVDASPNNAAYTTVTVSSGSVTLPKPRVVMHIGLPYLSDLETLDLDTVQGETLADKKRIIVKVTLFLETSRGIFAGAQPPSDDTVDPLENLFEAKIRSDESLDDPTDLQTDTIEIDIRGQYNSEGRIFIRQVDPIPLAVLAVAPSGYVPLR